MAHTPTLLPDPSLVLPDPPSPLPRLIGPGGWTEAEGAARDEFFFLAGRRALIWGREDLGIQEVRFHPMRALLNLEAGVGPADSVRVSPGVIRRDLEGAQGSVVERALAFRELPAAVIQWSRPTESEASLELSISFQIGPILPPDQGGHTPRFNRRGSILRVSLSEGDPGALYFLNQPCQGWEIHPEAVPDGLLLTVRARVTCPRGEAISLGVVGSPRAGEDLSAVLGTFRFLGAQEGIWEGKGRGDPGDPLLVDAGDSRLALGVDWAKARLDSGMLYDTLQGSGVAMGYGPGLGRPKESIWWPGSVEPTPPVFWTGLGALAAGRFSMTSSILEGAARSRAWDHDGSTSPTVRALFLLLAGEYVRWSGSPGILLSGRKALDRVAERTLSEVGGTGLEESRPLLRAGLEALADAAEAVGDRDWAALIRREAGIHRAPSGEDALPFPRAPWAQSVQGYPGLERGLEGWRAFQEGRPEEGAEVWMEHLLEGLDPHRGAWPGEEFPGQPPLPNHIVSAALLLATLVYGLLGAEADATFGRLRLKPRIPAGWGTFRVRNLRLGGSKVAFFYQIRDGRHRFLIHQEAGRVPMNLVFEPMVPGRALVGVRLDGEAVPLDPVEKDGWVGVRLQLPLDREREILLEPAT